MANCETERIYVDSAAEQQEVSYLNDVESWVMRLIGNPDEVHHGYLQHKDEKRVEVAKDSHRKLYNRLVHYLMDNGRETGFTVDPGMKIESLESYIQFVLGTPGTSAQIATLTPFRINSLYKLIGGILTKAENDTELSGPEKGLIPAIIYSYTHDKFGLISNFTEQSTQLTESSHSDASTYVEELTDTNVRFTSFVDTIMADNIINESLAMDGFDIVTNDGRDVRFLKSYKSEGRILHMIQNEVGEFENLEESEIPRENLLKGLSEKYLGEVLNDISHGQTRKVRFVDSKGMSKQDLSEVIYTLRKAAVKEVNGSGKPDFHTIIDGDIEYKYVMVKSDEQAILGDEEYRAYIVLHRNLAIKGDPVYYYDTKFGKIDKKGKKNQHKVGDVAPMEDGYYHSNSYEFFGNKITKGGKKKVLRPIKGTEEEAFTDFEKMDNPPSEILMNGSLTSTIEYANAWQVLRTKRSVHRRMKDRMVELSEEESRRTGDGINRLKKMVEQQKAVTTKDGMTYVTDGGGIKETDDSYIVTMRDGTIHTIKKEDVDEINPINIGVAESLENLMNFMNSSNAFWASEDEEYSTQNSYFVAKRRNYAPRMFEDDVITNMIEDTISDLQRRLNIVEAADDVATKLLLEEQILMFQDMLLNKFPHLDQEESGIEENERRGNLTMGQRTAWMKHRKAWVNPLLRRKDSAVDVEYVNNVFRSLHSNLLAATLLETVVSLADIGEMSRKTTAKMKTERPTGDNFFASGHIDYLVNRAKMALDDPSAKNPFGWMDSMSIANGLNKFVKDGRKWTEEDSYHLMKQVRSFWSTLLLGFQGAMYNRTQSVNDYIHIGYHYLDKAFTRYNNKKDIPDQQIIKAIIQNAGTDQALTAFADAMAPAGDIEFPDYGMLPIPFTGMYIPKSAMRDWIRMLRTNPDKFLEEGAGEDVDKYLSILEDNRLANKLLTGRRLKFWKWSQREIERLHSHSDRNNIKVLRKNFLDMLMTPNDNIDLLKEKFIRQLGVVSETRMKRMLAAKLSWSPGPLRSLNKWITFTGGEEEMRAVTVLANLDAARDAKTLGTEGVSFSPRTVKDADGNDTVVMIDDIYLSDQAVRVARRAVRNTMYGMSKEHMGDYFAAWGQAVFQYKEYPVQQMIHDFKILQVMQKGSMRKGDFVSRITKEIYNANIRRRKGIKYNPIDPAIDHEALAAARFVVSRGAMSIAGTIIDLSGLIFKLRRVPAVGMMASMAKGGENVLISILMRTLAWSAYYAVSDDDDDWSLMEKVATIGVKSLFPLLITIWPTILSQYYRGVKSGIDWIDSKTSVF